MAKTTKIIGETPVPAAHPKLPTHHLSLSQKRTMMVHSEVKVDILGRRVQVKQGTEIEKIEVLERTVSDPSTADLKPGIRMRIVTVATFLLEVVRAAARARGEKGGQIAIGATEEKRHC